MDDGEPMAADDAAAEGPEVENAEWVRNEVDAFVLARLESEGIELLVESESAPNSSTRFGLELPARSGR